MSKDTLFTNDTGAAGGTSQYVQDVLADVTFPASNNTGLTDTAATNPMGKQFADDDLPKFGSKTLYIKDLLLLSDRTRWISNKPTYQVIFQESFPQVNCYIFGNVNFLYNNAQPVIQLKNVGDGMAVNGVVRRVAWLVNDDTAATATAQNSTDGTNGTTIDFSSLNTDSSNQIYPRYSAFVHAASNETNDLHDIRLTALQANTLKMVGVIVYFENSGANLAQNPGTSYVNKTKSTTTAGATMAFPSFGSSLGGVATIYKTTFSGYTVAPLSAGTITSLGTGSSGTNLLTVSTGHGASFGAGYGVIMSQGTSAYVGNILSVSTDTLTMGVTLGFGTSTTASLYTAWKAGVTFGINASLMVLAKTIDFSALNSMSGLSSALLDPTGSYAFYGGGIGLTTLDSTQAAVFLSNSGFMQMDGYFSAAEIETIGNGIFHATMSVNGLASWGQNAGQTGPLRKTVFTDAGPGWNSFNWSCGTSMGAVGIAKINLYQMNRNIGISYGVLAQYDQCQTYTERSIGLTLSMTALGGIRRLYADQLYLKGTWARGQTSTMTGGAFYISSTAASALTVQYYGKNFGIIGSAAAGSTLTLDGSGVPLTLNAMQTVASEGFHTLQLVVASGATAIIQAVDFAKSTERLKVNANIIAPSVGAKSSQYSEVYLLTGNGFGSTATRIRRFTTTQKYTGSAITYADSSTMGSSFTINETGLYAISFIDRSDNSSENMGVSINSAALTTSVHLLPAAELVGWLISASGILTEYSAVLPLRAGDIIRPHCTAGGVPSTTANYVQFRITKVG